MLFVCVCVLLSTTVLVLESIVSVCMNYVLVVGFIVYMCVQVRMWKQEYTFTKAVCVCVCACVCKRVYIE